MRSTARLLALVALGVLLAPTSAFAGESRAMTPAELVAIDRSLDGTTITIVGEAIGEDLHADGDHRWVNVMIDGTAVGVWMANEDANGIEHFGDHSMRGDMLEVTGVVNIGCDVHGGEFDVHASRVEVTGRGAPTDHPLEPWKAIVGVFGLAIALLEARVFRTLQHRPR
jgi:hypothetical protein